MGDLTLKDLEDEILRSLALRADTTGRSLHEVAREALKRGLLQGSEERVALSRRIRAPQEKPLTSDTTVASATAFRAMS